MCKASRVECRRSLPQNQISHVLRRKTHEKKLEARPRDLDRQLCVGSSRNSVFARSFLARSFFAEPGLSRTLSPTSGRTVRRHGWVVNSQCAGVLRSRVGHADKEDGVSVSLWLRQAVLRN